MAAHDYSPRDALDLLMTKLREHDEQLASEIQSAIDAGKDVEEKESLSRRKRARSYRRTVRFSDAEALNIVIEALQAHFIEQPVFLNSAEKEFLHTVIAGPAWRSPLGLDDEETSLFADEGSDSPKSLVVELQTETQFSSEDQQTFELHPIPDQEIEQQKANLAKLRSLATFGEEFMATLQELENAIDTLLNHPLGAGRYQLVRRVEEKAYEAYVFGLCLRAARELGLLPCCAALSVPQIHLSFAVRPDRYIRSLVILAMRSFRSMGRILRFTRASNLRERAG